MIVRTARAQHAAVVPHATLRSCKCPKRQANAAAGSRRKRVCAAHRPGRLTRCVDCLLRWNCVWCPPSVHTVDVFRRVSMRARACLSPRGQGIEPLALLSCPRVLVPSVVSSCPRVLVSLPRQARLLEGDMQWNAADAAAQSNAILEGLALP